MERGAFVAGLGAVLAVPLAAEAHQARKVYRVALVGAGYIDRIYKGARPEELPLEQPSGYELAFNLKTAKTLGLTIRPSLLLRADQVIE